MLVGGVRGDPKYPIARSKMRGGFSDFYTGEDMRIQGYMLRSPMSHRFRGALAELATADPGGTTSEPSVSDLDLIKTTLFV